MTKRLGKAAILYGPGGPFKVEEEYRNDPLPGGMLLKVELCGVCGTDVHIFKDKCRGYLFL